MTLKCGWCITNEHQDCKKEIAYYERVWVCDCKVCQTEESGEPKPDAQ